ncbi:MAG: phosphonoacetate hydrolase [Alphaproteobacteria bacterium]|nr:phosphonoacetate hydrolase [Alphaproteobacteria bacterium]
MSNTAVELNGRSYSWPDTPVVGVCVDGSEPGYIEEAVKAGVAPFFKRIMAEGTNRLARCVIPSFTNPNNISIATGRPPVVHGICGNFFYDRDADSEVKMNDPKFLRTETIFKVFQRRGARICVITAKDKLRRLLGKDLTFGDGTTVSFSAETSDQTTMADHGIEGVLDLVGLPLPDVYSADLSEFIFAAGVKIMERDRPDIMYLSTTDYIQHKHAPGTPVANAFYAMMDGYLKKLDEMGCVIAITADHGMNAKHDSHGAPDVIYLQQVLDEMLGEGAARVILPITDPYVVHHGALGSFATVYLSDGVDREELLAKLKAMDGIEMALDREAGCKRFELPEDRVGDIIVVSTQHKVLGTTASRHDLSGLKDPLRSHGGVSEQRVPFLVNRGIDLPADAPLRNFDIYNILLSHVV